MTAERMPVNSASCLIRLALEREISTAPKLWNETPLNSRSVSAMHVLRFLIKRSFADVSLAGMLHSIMSNARPSSAKM